MNWKKKYFIKEILCNFLVWTLCSKIFCPQKVEKTTLKSCSEILNFFFTLSCQNGPKRRIHVPKCGFLQNQLYKKLGYSVCAWRVDFLVGPKQIGSFVAKTPVHTVLWWAVADAISYSWFSYQMPSLECILMSFSEFYTGLIILFKNISSSNSLFSRAVLPGNRDFICGGRTQMLWAPSWTLLVERT